MYKNYNTSELELDITYSMKLPDDHIAVLISRFVDSIPQDFLLEETSHTGRPAFHPAMLLKMTLFAYLESVFSGRKIAKLNQYYLPMMWLSGNTSVSYKTINNFRSSDHAKKIIEKAFVLFTLFLSKNGMLDADEALFIDGTKLEADANRYSFTWKNASDKFEKSLDERVAKTYDELIQHQVDIAISKDMLGSSDAIKELIKGTDLKLDAIEEDIATEPKVIKGDSKNKRARRRLKSIKRRLQTDLLPRKERYERDRKIFQGRNSFSKTDNDATFMRLKEDHMKNGQLKPAYNLQIATSGRFVLHYDIFPNPTDTRTLVPFLKSFTNLELFKYIVADAGYGNEANYQAVTDMFEKIPLMPYPMYQKEQSRKYKKDPRNIKNWTYHAEDDYYTDPDGVVFKFQRYSSSVDKYGFKRNFKVYVADVFQATKELENLAKTPKGYQRTKAINYNWEFFKNSAAEDLSSEKGSKIYARRRTDVETIFGDMKGNFGVRRVHVRGEKAVRNEIGLILLTINISKLWHLFKEIGLGFLKNRSKNKHKRKMPDQISQKRDLIRYC
ncbi:IS1182 family transposase [Ligilactobacillus faecis]|uniref:IS1182 family transposase n=1 Tax=Ligilactobacillus faecis TaxID=762833 RepID=A0ABV4DNU6_9LACO